MSQPQTSTPNQPISPAEAARLDRNRRRRRIIGYSILAILILPPLVDVATDPYGEVADWYYAAALENYEAGDRKLAEANLDKSVEWSQNVARAHRTRATWEAEAEQYEAALAELDRAVKAGGETTALLIQRSEIYQHLNRYEEAVRDWEKILEQSEKPSFLESLDESAYKQRRANVLNAVAYAQSLGKVDLPRALERISESLELSAESGMNAEKLDTRGYIHYLLGNQQAALADLNEAVTQMDAYRQALQKNLAELRRARADERSLDLALKSADRGLAVMLYHRALVYEALQQDDRAEADRQRVREITGREPDESLF